MPQKPLEEPKSIKVRWLALAKTIPVVLVLFVTLLAFNAAQTGSLIVLPFSPRSFRLFNRWIANTWWGWCVSAAKATWGTRIVLTGDLIPNQENAMVVVNHQQMPDITFLMFLARSKGRLGDMKWFVKDPIKYIPGVGWGMLFLDCPFIKRNWAADKDSIKRTFSRLLKNRVPVWLISFVEGTRITPKKLENSQAYSKSRGLTPTQHTLLPRVKGFVASIQGLRELLDAVYDVTIGYPEGVPTLWQYSRGLAREAHLHVRRTPIDQMPKTDQALGEWLTTCFREKDQLLERFYSTGAFLEA